jgi:hypothetical protein
VLLPAMLQDAFNATDTPAITNSLGWSTFLE